jgi:hypothetical protein
MKFASDLPCDSGKACRRFMPAISPSLAAGCAVRSARTTPYIDQGSHQKIGTFTGLPDSRRFICVDFPVGAIR